jgi:hypothetical protein
VGHFDEQSRLVVRTGDALEVAPNEFKTVIWAGLADISERGEVVFKALFADQTSGIFRSNRVAIIDGDFNYDGTVDAADFIVWRNQEGTSEPDADANFDLVVDGLDYRVWKQNFGATKAVFATSLLNVAVPEPSGEALAIIGALAYGLRRSNRAGRTKKAGAVGELSNCDPA